MGPDLVRPLVFVVDIAMEASRELRLEERNGLREALVLDAR
jgi:hypothetical protein